MLGPPGVAKGLPILPDLTAPESIKLAANDIGGEELSYAEVKAIAYGKRCCRRFTDDDRKLLARFPGFGSVALSLFWFPDSAAGRYKDHGIQVLGDELKSLLTGKEACSACGCRRLVSNRR